MAQQNNMRPQIPAGIARSPQFAAARSITQEGLPDMLKQLLEDEITFKAMDLLEGSASEQDMDTPVNPNSIRTTNREGLMNMLGSIGPGIRQQGQQMAMAQGQRGLPSQPTSNMAEQFAGGGIIGFAKGGMKDDRVKTKAYHPQPAIPVGNSNQPIPMLMQKYGGKKVLGYLEEKKALDAKAKAISEAGSAAGSMQVQDLRNMKEIFSEKYRDIISESMGMAGGGIVSFKEGGDDGLNPFSFVRWLGSKGLEAGALTGPQFEQLRDMYLRAGRELGDTRSVVERMADAAQSMPRNDLGRGGRSVVERMADTAQSVPRNDLGRGETPPSNAMTAEEIVTARALQGLDSGQTAPATNSFGQSVRGLLGLTNAKDATMRVAENEIQPTNNAMTAEEIVTARALQGLDSGTRSPPNTRQEFSAFPSNTASNQGSVLGEVASGAAGVMMDKAGTAMSQGQIGAREAQLESNRGGIGSALSNLGSIFNSEDAAVARQELQKVMQGNNSASTATAGIASGMDKQPMSTENTIGNNAGQGIASLSDAERAKLLANVKGPEYWTGVAPEDPNNIQDSDYKVGETTDPRRLKARETMNAFYEKNAGIPSTLTGEDREAALREYYKDSRSGDSSTVDVPMFPEATYQINKYADSDRFGSSVLRRMRENPEEAVSTLMMAMPLVGVGGTLGLGIVKSLVPYVLKHPGLASFLTGAAIKVPWEEIDLEGALSELGLGEDYEAVRDTLLTATLGEDPMRPPADTATSIIEAGPTREEIAANVSRKTEDGFSIGNVTEDTVVVPTATAGAGAGTIADFDSEVTTTDVGTGDSAELGTFLADSATGNISTASAGYQARLDAVIARQNNPIEAISTFLRAVGEGETVSEGMQIAGKALDSLRRSNDAEQIALLQLLETGRISEQDFQLKRLQIQNEQDQIAAFEDRSRLTYQASIASTLQRTDAALRKIYTDTFRDVGDAERMTLNLVNEAALDVALQLDEYTAAKPPSPRQLDRLMKGAAFSAAVTARANEFLVRETEKQLINSGSYSASQLRQ